jgi:hypothetical protein
MRKTRAENHAGKNTLFSGQKRRSGGMKKIAYRSNFRIKLWVISY